MFVRQPKRYPLSGQVRNVIVCRLFLRIVRPHKETALHLDSFLPYMHINHIHEPSLRARDIRCTQHHEVVILQELGQTKILTCRQYSLIFCLTSTASYYCKVPEMLFEQRK